MLERASCQQNNANPQTLPYNCEWMIDINTNPHYSCLRSTKKEVDMASSQALAEDVQESQQGDEGKREQSKIVFPYQDLDEGLEVAKAVHELHGSSSQIDQIAAHLKLSPTSSGLRLKISTAKTFGLVTASQGT